MCRSPGQTPLICVKETLQDEGRNAAAKAAG